MWSKKTSVLAILAVSALVAAGPLVRSQNWHSGKGGNLQVGVSDATIGYGSVDPVSIMHKIGDHCHSDGTCDPSFTVPSTFLTGNANNPTAKGNVEVTFEDAEFEVWAKSGLVGIFVQTMKKFRTVKHTSWEMPPSCVGGICPGQNKPNKINQYHGPSQMNVVVRAPNGGTIDFIRIQIKPQM